MDDYWSFRVATEYHYSANDGLKVDEVNSVVDEESGVLPFSNDIKALKKVYGFMVPGLKIEISLQEMLKICPRKRVRSDAYNMLKAELKGKYDVDLVITSRKKNKKKGGMYE